MKVFSLLAFVAPIGLALGAAIPNRLVQRQSTSSQGTFEAIGHDLERFKVDLSLLQASTAAYYGPANLPAGQRIIKNLSDLAATLEQATDDAESYARSIHSSAQQESDSQQVVAAINSVAPYARDTVNTLIDKRDDLEAGPFDAVFGNALILINLRTTLDDIIDLANALVDAVSFDQIANVRQAFAPIVQDVTRAYNYYTGF
ncbi:uncharacterized protein K489DRAFT_406688 [Dissoconium aciculare CBS 342.82]|uniref:Hydrophobic surface binding protein n=1 Tax=Dissoconium aciculare CBS 342.82 TaxID=1314786 RepID=A0A6J3MG59_9PEZI|nr:uncharacterized protein K489DRAFT_406688 [Dissoconium aciculare CBS 342.82]KAF1825877.1 hypothetical protein K489DRAFT_406688 [Dissoconium aciculare CBS 342.82]